ncbi:ATP-dependent protease [Desulfosarcina alkanivorans]|uniref:ATP-dependent protease n=1 Tax=Desulfosarcina alkanivorans TaxID=571177 RepID=A0A5K7YRE2_9BACT|nr:LON peptidase substrate-binding domain-containing protein [Desulfosarcina alkanivorans]BBO70940.1 ATP-dependent protease [Desulfosarcina alkanivorans]
MTAIHKIPMFPLGLVLLPGMLLPLHIFEARYRQMIADCLAEDRPFGIVLFDGKAIRTAGCTARIVEVVKRYDDGRMDILVRGGERFVIRELIEERAYMEARVVFFDDGDEAADDGMDNVIENALNLLKQTVDSGTGVDSSHPGGPIDPKPLAFAIAARKGFSPDDRQGLLEMTSASERLKKCVLVLSRIVSRNRLTREIQQMIGGNGNPPKSILRELEDLFKR